MASLKCKIYGGIDRGEFNQILEKAKEMAQSVPSGVNVDFTEGDNGSVTVTGLGWPLPNPIEATYEYTESDESLKICLTQFLGAWIAWGQIDKIIAPFEG